MERKDSSRRSSKGGKRSSSRGSRGSKGGDSDREQVVKEAVASVIVNERSKYESKIRASQGRLTKYTAENDRLLDEVSNLRLHIGEMKNDRFELVRAHHESMSLLAQVSEEKLVEFRSKSEQEAVESKAAQEEALRTVLEMMEKDCEDRVAELDNELARVEEDRERASQLQLEAAAKAAAEEQNSEELEGAAKLAVEKLVEERATRSVELQNLEEREKQLKHELEMTKQRAEMDKREAAAAHAAAAAASAVELAATMGQGNNNAFAGDASNDGSHSYEGSSYSEDRASTATGNSSHSDMSPLMPGNRVRDNMQDGRNSPEVEEKQPLQSRRKPVISRRSMHKYSNSPFLDDPSYEMTRGRKIALKLQQLPWYQPRGGKHWDSEGLGLQSAWAHFEHSVLPRYIVKNAVGSTPTVPVDDQRGKRSRVSVYESEAGSTDAGDDGVSNGESDVDDWLYTAKPKKQPKSKGKGQGFLQKGDLDRAEPGESTLPTKFYSPFFTPLSQLGDFGIGVGLYFSSLRAVAFITLIAGCINLPNMFYYASDEYSRGQPGVNFLLKGSAICTEQVWVPCPTCTVDEFDTARSRIAGATTVTPDGELQTLVFALKNTCDGAKFQVGIVNMASLGFILLAIAALSLYQRRKQIIFDEQEQTAQDYSIEISNPPADSTEPEEWKEFFESRFSGHLTCCTVTIDNDLLVKALAERREVLFEIEEKFKEGATLNTLTLSELAAKIEHGRQFLGRFKSRLSPGVPELVGRLTVLNARIQGLAQQEYRATRVFCTFETENAQRQVLSRMTVGSMAAMKNNTHKINPNLLFRGEHVLLVREAEEPSTIRWMDLDETFSTKLKQMSITTLISLACTLAVAVIVALCRRKSAAYAALAISISNALFPMVAKALTNFEAHPSESGKQSSLYVKIAIFRWVVTAIVITIITPFTSTITNGSEHLLQSIYVIFFADLVTTNVLQLVDPASNFKRHFLAPRAGSQERMNLLMGGTEYTIAERYTNMTKTLFLTFYYCAIYPSVFFLCALTLFVNFYVDKFSLMRTWKPAPMLGPYIAKFSRIYFMTTAIAALAVVSSYLYSGFPFDNLCGGNVSHSAYYGNWKITDGEGQDSTAVIEPGVRSYHFCNQFLGPGSNFAFPALPEAQPSGSNWMTAEQEQLTGIYGWVSVGVVGLIGLIFLYRILRSIQDLFSASYKSNGDVQGESFSEVGTISSYIPQVNSDRFTHPLLAVNIDYVGESIFDWSDPERSHSYYDMTRDAEQLMKGDEDMCQTAFAQIRHWPPGGVDVEEEGERASKSALRKSKDINMKRTNVSWSSKVTCKTYSKDDPNNSKLFNANASTSEGMNFNGHSDPLHDPHAQNEARVNTENQQNDAANFDPYGPNNGHDQQPQQNQPPPNQHFDQYYGAGLDDANQPPDPMYGGSQNPDVNQGDGASWEGDEGAGSYEQSGSSATSGSYSSASSGTDYSDASSRSDGPSSFNQQQTPNSNPEFVDEDGSGTYEESVGSSRGSSNTSASNYSNENPDGHEEFHEAEVYEDDQNWDAGDGQETGSFSTGSSASGGLPPVT
eukprot:CAMPEP_0172323196 /NCGR_PEP_ID=MMETSP1058-20130122/48111_1 /TAXON_ID=83371 /ORGANISM="Detonula confervacea, Strain CCMP 353" /LENGTH=1558 /DNA_ID=CAMNT_0013039143 /DNA_START=34 /DNA_END=4710 /DNA_ORIENTATION=-